MALELYLMFLHVIFSTIDEYESWCMYLTTVYSAKKLNQTHLKL